MFIEAVGLIFVFGEIDAVTALKVPRDVRVTTTF